MSIALSVAVKAMIIVPVTLLPILNPLAVAPIFLAMTGPMDQKMTNRFAKRVALNCFFLILGAFFIGSYVLDFFDISLPIVRIAGGIVVAISGWKLLNSEQQTQDKLRKSVAESAANWTKEELRRHSFYPFSFPLTVGPGTIAATIALGAQLPTKPVDWLMTSMASMVGILITTLAIFLAYRFARNLEKVLGEVGATVLMRLSAFILLCIGIEILWSGISSLLKL